MIRLYIDEDALLTGFVRSLTGAGLDVLTAEDADMRGRTDPEHLTFATAEGRVLFSHNRADYFALHSRVLRHGGHHAGIMVTSRRPASIATPVRAVLALAELRGQEGMVDWLEFIHV